MGDQPSAPNLPLSGEMVGRPNEFRIAGSTGEDDRNRGISFIGDPPRVGPVPPVAVPVEVADLTIPPFRPMLGDLEGREKPPNNLDSDFSFVGEGRGGGPISEVDRWRWWLVRKVGERGVVGREGLAGGSGELDLDPVRECVEF